MSQARRHARLERLVALADALNTSVTVDAVAQAVLGEGLAAYDADAGVVGLIDGDSLLVVGQVGYEGALAAGPLQIPLDAGVPLARAARDHTVVISRCERGSRSESLIGVGTDHAATVSMPLSIGSRSIGALGLGFRVPPPEPEDLALVEVLARLCAAALDRALLYEAERGMRAWAEEERLVVERLHEFGRALAAELDLDTILRVAVESAAAGSGAQLGAFFVNVERDGENLCQVLSLNGAQRATVEAFGAAVLGPTFTGERVIRTADVTADPAYDHAAPHLVSPDGHPAVRSCLAVPVRSRAGDALGGIFLGHPDVGVFDERAERLAVGVAAQAAVAIDNARLYEAEQRARREAERIAGHLARLQEITDRLAKARTVDQVTAAAGTLLAGETGTTSLGLYVTDPAADGLVRVGAWRTERANESPGRIELGADEAAGTALRDGAPVFQAAKGSSGIGSRAILPLQLEGRTVGVLSAAWSLPHDVDADERRFLAAVAAQVSQAVERVRLDDAEQRARADVARATGQIAFLAEASRLLASSLDYDETLASLTRLIVPHLADSAAILVTHADGRLRVVSAAHMDRSLSAVALRVAAHENHRGGYDAALRTLRPTVIPDITDELLREVASDEAQLADLRALQPHTALVVPMAVGGRGVGVITLSTGPSGRGLGEEDLRFVQDLADRAAIAVDNAMAYRRQRDVAVTLQRSLLPATLPELAGVSLDFAYVPGTAGTEVGGDWYDVIALPGERVGIVIGDVMGRGVRAAAVMGQVRATVRAYAAEDQPPAILMTHLDRVVQGLAEGQLVTCIYGVYDPVTRELRLSSAGHLPPLLVDADGRVRYLDVPPSLPLGVGGGTHFDTVAHLPAGATVLLYTDGLVEARDCPISEGMARLRVVAERRPPSSAAGWCSALLAELGRQSGHDDDTALLSLTTSMVSAPTAGLRAAHVQLEQATSSVAVARHYVRDVLASWGHVALADTAVLLASELVTNAVVHARTSVHVWVVEAEDHVRVDVVDASAAPVVPREAPLAAESGRGLHLVRTLSATWGSEPTPTGKRVWFTLPHTDEAIPPG